MRFIVDAQLPPALAAWLVSKGHEASHVAEIGLERAEDGAIWDRALAASSIIVTKDEDFAVRKALQATGPAILWIRVGNTTRPDLLAGLERHWAAVVEALERGDGIVEIS
jgi:predicted nuclease of predicted toxin-antitoxin system